MPTLQRLRPGLDATRGHVEGAGTVRQPRAGHQDTGRVFAAKDSPSLCRSSFAGRQVRPGYTLATFALGN
jgi:hypothetical protein